MTFPCTGCGICCKSVGRWVSIAQSIPEEQRTPEINEIATFPIPINSNGHCSELDENNGCRIYDSRPNVCSIEGMWEKYHSHEKSLDQYFAQTSMICNSMMDTAAVPKKIRINY